jgi:hypothetical protein
MTQQISFAATNPTTSSWGLNETAGARPAAAAPQAVQRFEQLMYSPTQSLAAGSLQMGAPATTKGRSMQLYVEHLSQRWESGQAAIQKILSNEKLTTSDLMQTQMQLVNCAIDIEVSSKCASIFESGVQTLVQRGGA